MVRAGLLSDPRVVALLRELFVPVHISALNTQHCMRDPRDAEILRASIRKDTDDFDGGEREAFLLPDGTMLPVFLSLHGKDANEWESRATHYTAAGRRAEAAVAMFRHRGAEALRRVHGEVPERWRSLWDDEDPAVQAVRAAAPRWPAPAPGHAGFRVFSRNSYRMYDDLSGAEIAEVDAGPVVRSLLGGQDAAELPRDAFVTLANAMVPRGMVDTELDADSIGGTLRLVVESRVGAVVEGRVEGEFHLAPKTKREVAKRENAACMFESQGRLQGHFTIDAKTGRILALRAVATDVDFAWRPGYELDAGDFAPWHRVAIEWVEASL